MVEFAVIATVAVLVLFVTIQLAMIGEAALSVSQLAYQGARWASINPSADLSALTSYLQSIAPPMLNYNKGANLSFGLTPSPTRTFGNPVSVQVNFAMGQILFLPNPFFGITLPTSLSSTETAMTE